jgi:hypothetical protein
MQPFADRNYSDTKEAIVELNLPTGIPVVCELDLKSTKPLQFLGDVETGSYGCPGQGQ